jgi:hypothetical protein
VREDDAGDKAPPTVQGRTAMTEDAGPSESGPVSFESDIRPLFREKDQRRDRRPASFRSMPCDGAWPAAQVELFQRWVDSGKSP